MKNITLSADEQAIANARLAASKRATTLNALFRDWLTEIGRDAGAATGYDRLMEQLSAKRSGGPISRDELNER